jgi:hypothetical protein
MQSVAVVVLIVVVVLLHSLLVELLLLLVVDLKELMPMKDQQAGQVVQEV